MKFIPAIEKTISQLNLRGYEQLANSISSSTKELVDSLLEQANYCISAPLAESGAYTLMVDCNIFMGAGHDGTGTKQLICYRKVHAKKDIGTCHK